MNPAEIQKQIVDLQAKRTSLEQEAVGHEQAARQNRADMNAAKADIADITGILQSTQMVTAAQKAMQSIEQSVQLVAERSAALKVSQELMNSLTKQLEAKITEADELLEKLKAEE